MTSPHDPGVRFAWPPNWPQPPKGWVPPDGWRPDPAWGPAPDGWQLWQPVPESVGRPPVSGYGIVALITGLLGMLPVTGVFGGLALRDIRRRNRRGRSLVFLGWSVCLLWLVGLLAFLNMLSTLEPGRAPDGTVISAGRVGPLAVRVGDCASLPDKGQGSFFVAVSVVPCDTPHNSQVIAIVEVDAGERPSDSEARAAGAAACRDQVAEFYGTRANNPELQVVSFVPEPAEWNRGDRAARCYLRDTRGDFVGDVRDR